MKKSRIKKAAKYLAISTIIIALFFATVHVFVDLFENEIFDFFVKKIEKKSGGLYSIKYDSVDLNFFKRSIHIKNLSVNLGEEILNKIKAESDKNRTLIKTVLPVLKIEGISILKLIFSKSLNINNVSMKDGELVIIKIKKNKNKKDRIDNKIKMKNAGADADDRAKKKLKFVKSTLIKNLNVDNISFILINPYRKDPILTIPSVSLILSKLKIFRKRNSDPKTYFSFESGESTLKEPTIFFRKGFYKLKAKELVFSKSGSFISIYHLELIPRYKRYHFSRRKGYRISRHSLKIDTVIFEGIHFDDFFENQRFYSQLLTVENPGFDIFRDNNMPKNPRPQKKKFPQQLLRELKFKLRIDHINVSNGQIVYTELPKGGKKLGKIFFNDIQAHLKNVTNYPGLLEKKISLVLTAAAKIMGKSVFRTKLTIPINNKKNLFTFSGSLEKTDLKIFNSMLENNFHVRFDSGIVNKLNFSARADNYRATGEMKLLYNNLKISIFEKEGEHKKRKIFSFLANTVIRTHNPKPGKPLRVGKIFFKREKPISMLKYIWKSLISGGKSSIGLKRSKK
jgi:hypothetical protein